MCGGFSPAAQWPALNERENPMAASQLTCRECGADYPLEALYVCHRCFGPLEVKYHHGHLKADLPELRRRIQSGPQNIWRYADFLPVDAPPGPSSFVSLTMPRRMLNDHTQTVEARITDWLGRVQTSGYRSSMPSTRPANP